MIGAGDDQQLLGFAREPESLLAELTRVRHFACYVAPSGVNWPRGVR